MYVKMIFLLIVVSLFTLSSCTPLKTYTGPRLPFPQRVHLLDQVHKKNLFVGADVVAIDDILVEDSTVGWEVPPGHRMLTVTYFVTEVDQPHLFDKTQVWRSKYPASILFNAKPQHRYQVKAAGIDGDWIPWVEDTKERMVVGIGSFEKPPVPIVSPCPRVLAPTTPVHRTLEVHISPLVSDPHHLFKFAALNAFSRTFEKVQVRKDFLDDGRIRGKRMEISPPSRRFSGERAAKYDSVLLRVDLKKRPIPDADKYEATWKFQFRNKIIANGRRVVELDKDSDQYLLTTTSLENLYEDIHASLTPSTYKKLKVSHRKY
ncbi:hypothetical protein BVX98_03885 [bacterium F11]|nr:hypothetical protein BVX98_03885 [bacterium F11]